MAVSVRRDSDQTVAGGTLEVAGTSTAARVLRTLLTPLASVVSAELPCSEAAAVRVTDPIHGDTERLDILNLMRVVGLSTPDEAIALLGKYFPASAASAEKQRFLLKHMSCEGVADAPKYLG